MGMILRIASSRIVGQGDIVGRSGYFSLNLSANSVMRGRLDARRTLKSLVADLRFIFFSGKASVREQKQEDVHFRLSYRYMVNAAAYHNGQKVAELTDVGFNNVDEVIARLVTMLPDDIPNRSMVMFKIVNLDKDQTVVYQRQKGKGF